MRVRVFLLIFLLVLPGHVLCREARRDPESNRIRILYLGDAWGKTPYYFMMMDPSQVGTPIPATYKHAGTYNDAQLRQFMRIYMPRTYGDLKSGYDLVILSDTNRNLYQIQQLEWFKRSVQFEGLGLMMVGGHEAFGGKGQPSWGASPVEEALPVTSIDGNTFEYPFRVLSDHPDDPFVKSLPWITMPRFSGMNVVTAKEGSGILLHADKQPNHPVLVYWEYGKGSTLAHMPDWTPSWGEYVMDDWEYFLDYVVNMNFLNSGSEVPQNIELMHDIRTRFHDYHSRRALAISHIEFVEKFGARTLRAEKMLFEIIDVEGEAEKLYLDQRYEEAAQTLRETEEAFRVLSVEVTKLKDRAMMWIYIVEWLVVSGALMACGTALWEVMVKRRLYRETRTTRLSFAEE